MIKLIKSTLLGLALLTAMFGGGAIFIECCINYTGITCACVVLLLAAGLGGAINE